MVAKVEKIVCRFIGNFKVGDNIAYNASALCRLSAENKDGIFNKLMVVQAGSIVEASLDQIIYRAQTYNREGVPNISEDDRRALESKTIERFNNVIQTMQGYKILDGLGAGIYDELHLLRKYRNRIHIQQDDDPKDAPRDEARAFTDKIVGWSLELCARVLKHLNERFPRPKDLEHFAHDIFLPTT